MLLLYVGRSFDGGTPSGVLAPIGVLPVPTRCRFRGTQATWPGIALVFPPLDVGGCGWPRLHIVLPPPRGPVVVVSSFPRVLLFRYMGLGGKRGKRGGSSIGGGA